MELNTGYDRLIGIGPDWVSASARKGRRATELFDWGQTLLDGQIRLGNRVNPWGSNGYRGVQGGGVRIASGDSGALVQLSGACAASGAARAATLADNWSRFDVALTTCSDDTEVDYAKRWWAALGCDDASAARRTSYALHATAWGGTTLNCGSRTSNAFGRIYDKHAETKGLYPKGAWRWEVEWKDDRAKQWQQDYLDHNVAEHWLAATTAGRFARWGVTLPLQIGYMADLAPIPRPRTSAEEKMRWLETQVRPSVRWLEQAGVQRSELERLLLGSV